MKRVLLIAGESSGDLHGSNLMSRIKAYQPDISFKGIGGLRMIEEGLEAVRNTKEMNFMGFVEIIRHLPFIRRTMKELESLLVSWHPDLVILIDYPGFNLKFAPLVKKRGIPLMYYISPQLWAWHKSRVALVKKHVDRMVVLFDFEREFYRKYGVNVDFVGHPLLDVVRSSVDCSAFRKSLGVDEGVPLVGLLPGSRVQEIKQLLPSMAASISMLRKKRGSVVAVLGCVPEIDDSIYEPYIGGTDVIPLRNKAYDIMAHSDVLVVTSGTATLEAGISGTPMVIVYRTSLLTYIIGRMLVNISNIGLINIVAGSRIVPELWQNQVTPDNIAMHIEKILNDQSLRSRMRDLLSAAKSRLGEPGASERAANIALEMMSG